MTAAGLELAERVHTEVRRALDPATGRLDATERQALTTAGTDARVSTGVNPGRASVQGSATRSLITLAAARSRDGERLALGHHCGLGLCLGAGVLCGRRRCVDAAVGGERLVPLLAGPLQ